MVIVCKLVKTEPSPSSVGGIPCELCTTKEAIGKELNKLAKLINESEALKLYRSALESYNELAKSHKTCAGCHLCFGGYHIAAPAKYYAGLGEVCQWCQKDIKKIGIDAFKERMKGHEG